MRQRWNILTCRTCGEDIASGLLLPGSEQAETFMWAYQEAHRAVDGCPADHLVMAPCTTAEADELLARDECHEVTP